MKIAIGKRARSALRRLGAKRFEQFVRAARRAPYPLTAVRLLVDELDRGTPVEAMFDDGPYGYSLIVEAQSANAFHVHFGCSSGPTEGDGGEWDVCFNDDDSIASIEGGSTWIS